MADEHQGATRAAVEAVWRIESARLLGGLIRLTRDVGDAEDLAQEALVAALERWPTDGIPANPGAWLMATARNRGVDRVRRDRMRERKHGELRAAPRPAGPDLDARIDEDVGDDLLRLVLVACHPILSTDARVALTLRLVCGLTTAEIARAFLASESAIAQRIVRARRTLAEARVPFDVPRGADLAARLGSVLEVVYLVFNEGYAARAGDDWLRPVLCEDALRLGRILAELIPGEPEVHGLAALMELHASRARARVGPDGAPIVLFDQDRSRWDRLLIGRGLAALARAEALSGSLSRPLGPYALQAAIAACHARAATAEATDWERIVALYDGLLALTGSPVVALNRAVAVGLADGPAAGLALVDALADAPALAGYHLWWCARAEMLARLGRTAEARAAFERAAAMTENNRERALLLARAAALG